VTPFDTLWAGDLLDQVGADVGRLLKMPPPTRMNMASRAASGAQVRRQR
jgi:hypothetical protein